MKVIIRLLIGLLLFLTCSNIEASGLRDTSANRFALATNKSLSLSDYRQFLDLATISLNNGKLDEGLQFLAKGIKQLDAEKKVMRVNGYLFTEAVTCINLITSGRLNKGEEYLGKRLFALMVQSGEFDYRKLVDDYLIQNPESVFAARLKLILLVLNPDRDFTDDVNTLIKRDSVLLGPNILRGELKILRADFYEALKSFSKVIRLSPYYAYAYFNRGICYSALKRKDDAIKDFAKAVELFPDYALACEELVSNQILIHDYRSAISSLRKLITMQPGYKLRDYKFAECYDGLNMPDSALYYITNYITLNPKNAEAYSFHGKILYNLNRYDAAIQNFSKAIKIQNKDHLFYNSRADAYYCKNQVDSALLDFLESYKIYNNSPYTMDRLGDCYADKKEYGKALYWYKRALVVNPSFKYAYVGMGRIFSNDGKYQQAIASFEKAIKIDSTYDIALENLARTHYSAGDFAACINYSNQILQHKEDAVDAMFNIPLATLRMGYFNRAKLMYQSFINLCNVKGYQISGYAVKDLRDLIGKKIMAEEAKFILKTYFNQEENP